MRILLRVRRPAPSRVALAAIAAIASAVAGEAAAEILTLSEALSRAAAHDPAAPAADARTEGARAGLRQAGVGPYPTVGVDMENIVGSGDRDLFDGAETTVYYQRTWERGGKPEARRDVASAELEIVRHREAVRRLDLLAEVQSAWAQALAAQALVGVAEARLSVAERLATDVDRRVAAARDPLFAGERARTAVAQARIDRDQAVGDARRARAVLAAFWGGEAAFDLDAARFEQTDLAAPGPLEATPDLALLAAERDAAAARTRLERARAVQDPTWRAGVRHFQDGGDVALIVGGSIPLGRRDTNRGEIERAQAERRAMEIDLAAARVTREREVARLLARQSATAAEIRRIDAEVLPGAARAVALVLDGYRRGGGAFTYLEVAEAQRAVIEARTRRIELLKTFHLDGVRLDRLGGRHAPVIARAEPR